MRKNRCSMNTAGMVSFTSMSKHKVQVILDLAEAINTDNDSINRKMKSLCKCCHYHKMIGGSAITQQDCMSCGIEQVYGSTSTDKLCLPCAKLHRLCKHCGGDVNLRVGRRNWPSPIDNQPQ